jgi:hypothetical protein
MYTGGITINIQGGDPYTTARAVKRALETNDLRQRGPAAVGRPLARAW